MASTLTARVGVIGSIWAEVAELAENPLVQRVISVFDKVDHGVDGKSWWGGWLPLMRVICFEGFFLEIHFTVNVVEKWKSMIADKQD